MAVDQSLSYAMTPGQRKALTAKKAKARGLHAAEPGSGPEGQTYGSCACLMRKQLARAYLKCGRVHSRWTRGPGTDVRAKDPACSKWLPKELVDIANR